jgi:hypothetical protein
MLGEGITHGSPGLVGVHVTPPAFHRHHFELSADRVDLVEETGQLAIVIPWRIGIGN